MQRSSRLPQTLSVISFNYIGVNGRRQFLAIHVGEYQSTPRKSSFHNKRSFIIRCPLASIIFWFPLGIPIHCICLVSLKRKMGGVLVVPLVFQTLCFRSMSPLRSVYGVPQTLIEPNQLSLK